MVADDADAQAALARKELVIVNLRMRAESIPLSSTMSITSQTCLRRPGAFARLRGTREVGICSVLHVAVRERRAILREDWFHPRQRGQQNGTLHKMRSDGCRQLGLLPELR